MTISCNFPTAYEECILYIHYESKKETRYSSPYLLPYTEGLHKSHKWSMKMSFFPKK